MPNYQNGKIYKITSPSTNKIYVGSTTRLLNLRFRDHKYHYKTGKISSAKMLQYNDCVIELIEEYPCNSKKELCEREQFYMNLNKDNLVNFYNSIRKCTKEYLNKYRSEPKNKEKMCVYNKNYKEKNKEKLIKKQKVYYNQNKETINQQKKILRKYQSSWGGNNRSNNNLLEIDTDLFN